MKRRRDETGQSQYDIRKWFGHNVAAAPDSDTDSLEKPQKRETLASAQSKTAVDSDDSDEPENFNEVQEDEPSSTTERSDPSCSSVSDVAAKPEDGPCQPKLKVYPRIQCGAQKRSFQSDWYGKYKWLEYSVECDKVYCFCCRLFGSSVGHKEAAFTSEGCSQWKKMHSKASKHENSVYHAHAMEKWLGFNSAKLSGDVKKQVVNQHKQQVLDNREYIKTLMQIAITCAKTNMPLRGHDETDASVNKGVFLELFDLVSKESDKFCRLKDKVPENAKYTSWLSQNFLLRAVSDCIIDDIIKDAKSADFFALIADETRDVSVTEQLSICIRYVKNRTVNERFLGFVALKDLDADSLAQVLQTEIAKLGLDVTKLVAQCYDTASVMSGKMNGVQARMREFAKNPCYYVPCFAHRLQLVITHTAGCMPEVSQFFDLISSIINFIRSSTLRHDIFIDLQKEQQLAVMDLPKVCQHKWEYNHKALKAIFQRFDVLVDTFQDLSTHGRTGDEKAMAKGFLQSLMKFETIFLLVTFIDIFDITTPLSKTWQSENVDVAAAVHMAQDTMNVLKDRRSEQFDAIWQKSLEFAKARSISPSNPQSCSTSRVRKPSSRLMDYYVLQTTGQKNAANADDPKSHCRISLFCPTLDKVLNEITQRFDEPKGILLSVAACHPKSRNFLSERDLQYMADEYCINSDSLHAELLIAGKTLQDAHSITNALEVLSPLQQGFSTLWTLMHLALTFPVANAKCERSFSVLKLVKTYLRSTMGQERLTSLGVISIEKEMANSLNLDRAVDKFAVLPIPSQSGSDSVAHRRLPLK